VAALEAAARHEGDPNARAALLLALGRTGRREAIPSLLAVLDEGNLWLRVHALEALGEMGDPDVAARILPLLSHPPLRRAALKALSRLESAAPIEELTRRAAASCVDGTAELDEALLGALRRAAGVDRALFLRRAAELWPEAGDALRRILASADASGDERTDAAYLLALLDAPGAANALVQHGPFEDGFEVLQALPSERFSEALSAALQAEDPEPALALVALARSRGLTAALGALLVHPSPVVRAAALGSLPPGSVPVGDLIDILAEEDPETALASALALAAATPDSPDLERVRRTALVDRAGGPDGPGRAAAVQALAGVDLPEAAGAIRLALGSSDPEVRRAAALSAGQRRDLGPGDFVPRLVDEDFGVRAALLRALARRAEAGLPPAITWRELLPSLADEPAVAAAAGAAIVALAGEERPRLVDEMLAQSDPVRRAALEELLLLKDPRASGRAAIAIHHEDVETARAAIEAQEWTPARAAEVTLAHALGDSRLEVRQTAAEVIGRRPAPESADGPLSRALATALHAEREAEVLEALFPAVAVAGGRECLEPLTIVLAAESGSTADGAAEALAHRFPAEVRALWADAPARAERRWARAIAKSSGRRGRETA